MICVGGPAVQAARMTWSHSNRILPAQTSSGSNCVIVLSSYSLTVATQVCSWLKMAERTFLFSSRKQPFASAACAGGMCWITCFPRQSIWKGGLGEPKRLIRGLSLCRPFLMAFSVRRPRMRLGQSETRVRSFLPSLVTGSQLLCIQPLLPQGLMIVARVREIFSESWLVNFGDRSGWRPGYLKVSLPYQAWFERYGSVHKFCLTSRIQPGCLVVSGSRMEFCEGTSYKTN